MGSGPAGLACAQQLTRAGYRVTVYEKAGRIGGLLRYGIPDFRQEKVTVDRRLAQLVAKGVTFRTNTPVNSAHSIDELRHSARAVVLACGAEQPRDIKVPGRELNGIHFAMEYLSQQNRRIAGDAIPNEDVIDARGKDVVVIGGGDTGSDCVGTAIRQGARSVTQAQYHDRPPASVDVLQYWPEHVPVYHETDHDDEGCRHLWGWDTVAFEGRAESVEELAMQHLQWIRQNGVWYKHQRPGERQHIPAQLVLLATGFTHTWHLGLVNQIGLATDARGNVSATDDDYQTSLPGIFVCGDMRRGQSLIVWAIREGRQCAHAVDEWLAGSSDLPLV